MSLLSSRLAFTHSCTIERDGSSGTNTWGQPDTPDWQPNLTGQPCRAWVTAGHELADTGKEAVVEDMRLLLPLDTDVTERDRVASVTYRGSTIIAGPVGIRAVMYRPDHLELVLVRIA